MGFIKRIVIKSVFSVCLVLFCCGAKVSGRDLVGNVATVFDVTKYGAVGDGESECAQAFIQTWNAACQSTGIAATIVIPPGKYLSGEVFFQGPCTCSTPITVNVQGTILAQTDLSMFPNQQWFSVESVDGLIIKGGGTFNGQGETAWPHDVCGGKTSCNNRLTPSIVFGKVKNTILQDINLVNSKGFHMKIGQSYNFTARNLHIIAPGDSPNTDGIHISDSNLVTITNSKIGTGDDCISVGEGSTNVIISGITCGPGHGISIGSLGKRPGESDVRRIVVTNCTLTNTTNGARIKSWQKSLRSAASGIVYENIVMNNVRNPIFIDQNYGSKRKSGASLVKISDVHFKNIRGTTTSSVAVALKCSKIVPCEGIELVDINLTFAGRISPAYPLPVSSSCENAKAAFLGKQNPSPCRL